MGRCILHLRWYFFQINFLLEISAGFAACPLKLLVFFIISEIFHKKPGGQRHWPSIYLLFLAGQQYSMFCPNIPTWLNSTRIIRLEIFHLRHSLSLGWEVLKRASGWLEECGAREKVFGKTSCSGKILHFEIFSTTKYRGLLFWALTSSRRPFRHLNVVLCALWALRLCDPRSSWVSI